MTIYNDKLDDWALRAMQTLQAFVDDAQGATGDPDGDDQLLDVRALVSEYTIIENFYPVEADKRIILIEVSDEIQCWRSE